MNNDDALYLLGIEGAPDRSTVQDAYERRRLEYAQRLSTATTEGLKQKYHITLNDLDQAYNLLLQSTEPPTIRRGANASHVQGNASTGGTILRSESAAQLSNEGLQIGNVLANRYEIRRVLGQGGMGAVYEAFDRLKQERIALKVLLPQYLGNEQGRDRFMHEAKIACRLAHPHIVKVFDVGFDPPYYFITMELLEGQTLRDQMETNKDSGERYSVQQVIVYARQLIAALEYAHKQIVHRDLKPENVWVCSDGSLKLIDFGIARAFTNSALTRTGMVMGTAYYMAPEQFNGAKNVDWHADQYSLGVILYELLAGRIPQGRFATTSELRRDVPMAMSQALMTALSPEPHSRFDSLAAFSEALTQPSRSPLGARKAIIAAAATASIVAIALIAWWLSYDRGPQTAATASLPRIETGAPINPASSLTPVGAQHPAPQDPQQAEPDRVAGELPNEADRNAEPRNTQTMRDVPTSKAEQQTVVRVPQASTSRTTQAAAVPAAEPVAAPIAADETETAPTDYGAFTGTAHNNSKLMRQQQAREEKMRARAEKVRANLLASCAKSGKQTPECLQAQQQR